MNKYNMNKYIINKYVIIIFIIYIIVLYITNTRENFEELKTYNIPKNIFTFWNSSKLDPLIEYHIQIWEKKLPYWKIHILTMDNINEYIDKKYYIQFINLSPQHFSDHVRLYLLEKYGGLWMDGSILIRDPTFIYNLYNDMYNKKSQLGVFEYKINTINNSYPYLENWFIMAPKNSYIIKLWKIEFDKCQKTDETINKCRNIIINSGTNINKTIKDNNYLMQHAILNMLCNNKSINLNDINILQASDSMFYLQDKVNWNVEKLGKILLSDEINKYNNVYAIKYTKYARIYLSDRIQQYKQYQKFE